MGDITSWYIKILKELQGRESASVASPSEEIGSKLRPENTS